MNSDIYEIIPSNSNNNDTNTTNSTSSPTTKKVKTVKVKVIIDDDKELKLDKKEYEATETIYTSFTGRNTVKVKVYIDGDWKNKQEYKFDLNEKTDIKIE